jgi:hypothetical protein
MAPTESALVRSGRLYQLMRGEEAVGEVRRRGVVKRRYEVDFGGRTWLYFGDGRKAGVNRVFNTDGRECASLEASEEGYGIVLDDEALDMRLVYREDGTREWVDERGELLLRLGVARRSWLQKGGTVADLERTDRPWPGSAPEGAEAVATATICAWFVQDLDRAGDQLFRRLT